jgi:1,4-alpha-glucan branching enzyme
MIKHCAKGYWIPLLHAHLPFVKHPDYDYFLEEQWLFEAISESYIPLLMNMKRMVDEDIDFRLTISLSPPLLEMLSDEHLMDKYVNYLNRLIELSAREIKRLKVDRDFRHLAGFYKTRYEEIRSFYSEFLKHDVVEGFRYFNKLGKIEIITSCATHGLLPLLNVTPGTVEAQVRIAVESHLTYFGSPPNGIWLPECAYYEGLDGLLDKYGIRFFFLDSHGLMRGSPVPKYGVYAPVYTDRGVAAFGRDLQSSGQVWSAEEGYPGDVHYRDFYRDAGFDLDFDYIKPYISPDGKRVFTGIKYYRITGRGEHKEPYVLGMAKDRAKEHAGHFCDARKKQVQTLGVFMNRPPVLVSPYDAELFGHWWFEGPVFLYYVFCELRNQDIIEALTPSEYLKCCPENQVVSPCPSSWGDRGYFDAWLNEESDWIYRHLHQMADKMENIATAYYDETDALNVRCLNQLSRELLLAQSSDWAFLITTNTAREYSINRLKEHIGNFNTLYEALESDKVDVRPLEMMENKNSIFGDLDFRIFSNLQCSY